VPASSSRQRPCWPAGIRAEVVFPGHVIDVHSKQDGAIYHQVTLDGSDVAQVSLLSEYRADVLERLINS